MENLFVFMTCQIGAEKALKTEVNQIYPELRFAFSRPGFLTFKVGSKDFKFQEKLIFARHWGWVVEQAKGMEAVHGLARRLSAESLSQKVKVHAFARDSYVPGDEPEGFDPDQSWKKTILDLGLKFHDLNKKSKPAETVFNWIQVDPDHVFFTKYVEPEWKLIRRPGRIYPVHLLEKNSPSRAQLKIKEVLERYEIALPEATRILEIGCSPGGATQFFLDHGHWVMGIDPKRMAFGIERNSRFKWVGKEAAQVSEQELEGYEPDLLVVDINIAPLEAIDQWGVVLRMLKDQRQNQLLKRAFLTIKLNDWAFSDQISLYFKRIQALGFEIIDATQLSTNRQEFFVLALYHGENLKKASPIRPDRKPSGRGPRASDKNGPRRPDAFRADRKAVRFKAR